MKITVLVLALVFALTPALVSADELYVPNEDLAVVAGAVGGLPLTLPSLLIEKAIGSDNSFTKGMAIGLGHLVLSPVTLTVNAVKAVIGVLDSASHAVVSK